MIRSTLRLHDRQKPVPRDTRRGLVVVAARVGLPAPAGSCPGSFTFPPGPSTPA